MAWTTVGNHLNTRIFLLAFQLCIWDGCNQVGNNSVDKIDIERAMRTSHASSAAPTLSLSSVSYNAESSLFKSSFSFLFPLRKVLLFALLHKNSSVHCT